MLNCRLKGCKESYMVYQLLSNSKLANNDACSTFSIIILCGTGINSLSITVVEIIINTEGLGLHKLNYRIFLSLTGTANHICK